MNYTSLSFWLMFFVILAVYWRLGHRRQNHLLLLSGYFLYGLWDHRFLFLILTSTLINYIAGLGICGTRIPRRRWAELFLLYEGSALLLCANIDYGLLGASVAQGLWGDLGRGLPRSLQEFSIPLAALGGCAAYAALHPFLYRLSEKRRRVAFLAGSVAGNLAILSFFKYYDFFVSSLQALSSAVGLGAPGFVTLNLILPAGISFYTFQAMSYPIDIYRGEIKPTERLSDFALFVSFFPHLVAGPIMRAHTLLPQIQNERFLRPALVREGWYLILLGLFKKLVIADNMALIANRVFLPLEGGLHIPESGLDILVGIYAFAFQIYGDFSGYSAVARGISKLLGFELVINFDNPYLAVTPSDLWRRWHISLSSWFRDYLYIPLGGNRRGEGQTVRNQIVTTALCGLWHGANLTFVLWGVYHGFLLAAARLFRVSPVAFPGALKNKIRYLFRVILMFHLICLGWLFFRADSIASIGKLLGILVTEFRITAFAGSALCSIVFFCAPLFLLEVWTRGEKELGKIWNGHWSLQSGLYSYVLLMIVVFHAERTREFIYFQF